MANFAFNIAKGRMIELHNRVKNNDPANSALVLIPLSASGTQAQGEDLDDVAAVLASGFFTERTTGGWSRKVLTDADLAAAAPDDVNNRYPAAVPQVSWTTPAAGNNTTGLLLAYDNDTTAGNDANLIPLAHFDFAVTTDGNDVVINTGDYVRAV
jgi:hypothetical protein